MLENNNKNIELSIVITTYNRQHELLNLIKSILESKLPLYEIIVVGTNKKDFNLIKDKENVTTIVSKIKNQVYQRSIGLENCNGKFILQVDDDLIFEKNAISILYNNILSRKDKSIIAINLLDSNGNQANKRWVNNYNRNYILRFLIFFLNGFQKVKPCSLILSGRPVPYYLNNNVNKYQNSEWLNSCFIFNKSSLKDYNQHFMMGKSYYEDIFTTYNFYRKGYKLLTIKEAKAYHPITEPMNLFTHLKSLKSQFMIVKRFKKSFILFFLDSIIFSLVFLFYTFKNIK